LKVFNPTTINHRPVQFNKSTGCCAGRNTAECTHY